MAFVSITTSINGNNRTWNWGHQTSATNIESGTNHAFAQVSGAQNGEHPFGHMDGVPEALAAMFSRPVGLTNDFFFVDSLSDAMLRQVMEQSMQGGPSGPAPCSRSTVDKIPTAKIEKNDESPLGTCAICLEDFEVGASCSKLPCDHHFHPECVQHWLLLHNSCPTCRKPLPDQPQTEPELQPNPASEPPQVPGWLSDDWLQHSGLSSIPDALSSVGQFFSRQFGRGATQAATDGGGSTAFRSDPAAANDSTPQTSIPQPSFGAAENVLQTDATVWREVRSDAQKLSVSELRTAISDLGGSSFGCLEKSELVDRYLECLGCDLAV
jgi:hypothetical protein